MSIFLLFILVSSIGLASASDPVPSTIIETQISTNDSKWPAIHGNRIVWQGDSLNDENNNDENNNDENNNDEKKKGWEVIPVNITGSDDKYLYFSSNVPEYSSFVISGMESEPDTRTTEPDQIIDINNMSENVNTIENNNSSQTSVDNKRTPGFDIIGGIISLSYLAFYKLKEI